MCLPTTFLPDFPMMGPCPSFWGDAEGTRPRECSLAPSCNASPERGMKSGQRPKSAGSGAGRGCNPSSNHYIGANCTDPCPREVGTAAALLGTEGGGVAGLGLGLFSPGNHCQRHWQTKTVVHRTQSGGRVTLQQDRKVWGILAPKAA